MTFSRRQKRIMEELEKLKTLLNSFDPVTIQKAINEIEEVKQETNVIIPEVVQVVEKKKSVGCPLKFTCKEEMQVLGEKYFKECKENLSKYLSKSKEYKVEHDKLNGALTTGLGLLSLFLSYIIP